MDSIARTSRKAIGIALCAGALFTAGLTACGESSANSPQPGTPATAATSANDEASASVEQHHRYHHHGGVNQFIAMSIDTLGVSPEQKTAVEKIQSDLHSKMQPARAAEQNLMSTLADEVANSNFDSSKVDAAVGQVTGAVAQGQSASVDALNQLHQVLTPEQRAALVDKVESHWQVWQKANTDESAQAKAQTQGGAQDERLSMLAKELSLTSDQTDKIRAALPQKMSTIPRLDPQVVESHIREFSNAFKSDNFDAKTLQSGGVANAHMVGWGAAHMAHFVEAVSPVLTPDQRTKFAQMLREHASDNPAADRGAQ